jgi:hypothetical protein
MVSLMLPRLITVTASLLYLTGCADMFDGTSQTLSIQTKTPTFQDVAGAQCQLSNNKGTWMTAAPGIVTVHRSYDPISVACSAPGYLVHAGSADSTTKNLVWGNLVFGGIIGAAVDIGTGAAYDYPSMIIVPLQPIPQDHQATPTS